MSLQRPQRIGENRTVPEIRGNILNIGFESVFAFTIWQSLPNLKYWSRLHLPKLELHSSLIR